MPRKKKTANEMPKEDLAKKVFPKKVRKELDRIVHDRDKAGRTG